MFRITPICADTALDATNMANSLANSQFWFRSLTETSEDLGFYVQPNEFVPAFNLPMDKTSLFSRRAYENFSATMRSLFTWDAKWQPLGWNLYNTPERVEFFGFMFRKKLSDLTYHLLQES